MSRGRYHRLLGRRPAKEVDAELRFHLGMLEEEYLARGLSPDEARHQAAARMGDLAATRDDCIEIDRRLQRRETVAATWDTLVQDVRLAARMFARQKLWTALAVLTLGIGVGANSALFSIVNAVLLRPLPYVDPDRIMSISVAFDGADAFGVEEPTYTAWKARAKDFTMLAATRGTRTVLRGSGDPELVAGRVATYGYFAVFGIRPIMGRVFTADEDRPGAPRVVILSEQIWRRLYGADPSIVGRTILMDENPSTVIGVMPASFTTSASALYWEPYRMRPVEPGGPVFYTGVVGKLAPGKAVVAAMAELQTLIPARATSGGPSESPVIMTLHERRFGDTRPALVMLFAAVGVLLMIACANVANLLLARAARRQREFAVRAAIGASAWRLVRFTLCESVLLAVMGAAAGLVIATITLGFFVRLSPPAIAAAEGIRIDAAVVAFTAAVAIVTGVAFGLIPALQVRRVEVNTVLASHAARLTASSRQAWIRRALVVGEMATALMLLTGAGLLTKSFARVASIDRGIDPRPLVVATVDLSYARYSGEAVGDFYRRFADGIRALPNVESVALADAQPLHGVRMSRLIPKEGTPGSRLDVSAVSAGYFHTIGARMVAGRPFDASDVAGAEPVAVLNETGARTFGKGGTVVGQRLPLNGAGNPPVRIVGVVQDLLQRGTEESVSPILYLPLAQEGGPSNYMIVVARASADPSNVIPAIRDIMRRIDPLQPLPELQTLEEQLAASIAPRRFTFALLTVFAAIGGMLAMIGLYGVMSYLVAERTNEIGVRVALGADARRIIRFVVGEGMILVAAGVALGLAGSLAGARLLRAMLFRMSAYDPAIFAGAAALLILTALVACAMPARRAARLDPVEALRSQ